MRSIFVRFLDVEVEQSIVELSADEEFEREVVGSFDFLLSVVQLCVVPILEKTVSSAQSNSLEDSCLVDIPRLTSEGRSENSDDAVDQASQRQLDSVLKGTVPSVKSKRSIQCRGEVGTLIRKARKLTLKRSFQHLCRNVCHSWPKLLSTCLHHQGRSTGVVRVVSHRERSKPRVTVTKSEKRRQSTHLLQSFLTLLGNESYVDSRSIRLCSRRKREMTGEPVAVRCFWSKGRLALSRRVPRAGM